MFQSVSTSHDYTLHTHKHIFLENIGCNFYNSKHIFMNIFITKTHNMPNIYQKIYPTYESMGVFNRDMQRRKQSQFLDQNRLNPRGLLGTGPRVRKTHIFFRSTPFNSSPMASNSTTPKSHHQIPSTTHQEQCFCFSVLAQFFV